MDMQTVMAMVNALRQKPAPEPVEVPRHLRRVKTPAEYEEEDRAAQAQPQLQRPVQQSGQKLVPDSVMNYE